MSGAGEGKEGGGGKGGWGRAELTVCFVTYFFHELVTFS